MTPAAVESILKTVELGIWPDTAARRHGVNPSTLRSFKAANEEFRTALEQAESTAQIGFHGRVMKVASGEPDIRDDKGKVIARGRAPNWRAAAWLLEKRWPAQYGTKEPPLIGELNVGEGGTVKIEPGPPMPEAGEWAPYVEKLAEVTALLDKAAAKRNGNGVPSE